MSNRYFVLATGDNLVNSTGTWSANPNGSPTGASVPTSSDAILPSTSIAASANLKVNANLNFASMDCTGVTNSPHLTGASSLNYYGNVNFTGLGAVTWNGLLSSQNTSGTATINSGGLTLACSLVVNSNGGTTALGSNTSLVNFDISSGAVTFSCGGYNFTCSGYVYLSSGTARKFDMSGSTVTCATWTSTNITGLNFVTDATSKIVLTAAGTFNGGGLANYPETDLNASGTTIIAGANTFANLVLNSGVAQTIQFPHGATTTVTNCSLSGSAGNVHTLTTDSGTSTWSLAKSGGGTISVSYCTISYSVASPANTWYYDSTCTYNGTSGWNLGNVILAPAAMALTWSGFASILNLGVLPGKMTLTWSGKTPVEGLGLLPATMALVWAGYTPIEDLGMKPSPMTLTFNGFAPILGLSMKPSTMSLIWSGLSPKLNLGMKPGTMPLTWSGYSPILDSGILPAPMLMTFNGFAPIEDLGISPGVMPLVLSGYAPQMDNGLYPAKMSLIFTGKTPSLGLGILPAEMHLILRGYPPSLDLGLVPGPLSLVWSGYSPSLDLGIYPAAMPLIWTGYPPIEVMGTILVPAPMVLVFQGYPPVLIIGVTSAFFIINGHSTFNGGKIIDGGITLQ